MLAVFVAGDGPDGIHARTVIAKAGEAAIPDLADVETTAVLRKRWINKTITARRFAAAIDDLAGLPFRRYPTLPLLRRAYELRANITAYDAVYIALAEALNCVLMTADAKLARTSGPCCDIRVLHSPVTAE